MKKNIQKILDLFTSLRNKLSSLSQSIKFKRNSKSDDDKDQELYEKLPPKTWKQSLEELKESLKNNLDLRKTGVLEKSNIKEKFSSRINFELVKKLLSKLPNNFGQFEQKVHGLLTDSGRKKIHIIFLLIMTFLIPFELGKITALVLKGRPLISKKNSSPILIPDNNPIASVQRIRATNLFRIKLDEQDQAQKTLDTGQICKEGTAPSSLPIQIISTSVLQDEVKSLASVQVRGAPNVLFYRVGEQIQNMARVEKIDRLKVHLKNLENGSCEYIENKDKLAQSSYSFGVLSSDKGKDLLDSLDPAGIKNDGNNFDIDCSFFKEKLQDMGNILKQARGVPVPNPDGTLSFKIEDVVPDGIFAHLGIQSDDYITKINGKPMANINEVINLFGKIATISKFELTIMRGSLEQNLSYNIANCPQNQSKAGQ